MATSDGQRPALININIPDEDGWRDDFASRVLFFVFALLLFRLGLRVWAAVEPAGVVAAIPTLLCFAGGLELLLLIVSDRSFDGQIGKQIGYVFVILLTAVALITIWQTNFPQKIGTDALAFASYGVELFWSGQNPMAASLEPASELPGAPDRWTPRIDGSTVWSWSYPAGLLWAFSPQWLVSGRTPGLRVTSILWTGALGLTLVRLLPGAYAGAGLISMTGARDFWFSHAGGLVDVFWVLPSVAALAAWYRGRTVLTASLLGVAASMKHQPMLIAPFLGLWLWFESDGLRHFARQAAGPAAAGLAVFGVLNAPLIIWDPAAWWSSVMTPLGGGGKAPLISTGVGLAVFAHAGLDVPRWLFRAISTTAGLGLVLAYVRLFDQFRWTAWLASPVVLLWMPRSLPSYFIQMLPLAVVALFAAHGRLDIGDPQGVAR